MGEWADRRRAESRQRIEVLSGGLLLAALLVALALVFWGVVREPVLAQREDNPRVVEEELRIRRGRILDSNDNVLAETVGPPDAPERFYPVSNIGPAVGYYSFRYGTAGVEEGYNAVLRGDSESVWETFWRENLHRAQTGRDIRLTLNASWQRAVDALLGTQQGAALLLTLPDAAIRVMASHPSYDPNRLDEQFDDMVEDERAPLLNRATQGQYQPGLVLQPFLFAAAVGRDLVALDEPVTGGDRPVVVHGQVHRCVTPPSAPVTWADVLQHACPFPMGSLAERLDAQALAEVYAAFGLTTSPRLPLNTTTTPPEPVTDVAAALLGQENLTVTPLQVSLAWAALGNGGEVPSPQLVAEVQDEDGTWQAAVAPTTGSAETGRPAVTASTAVAIVEALSRHEDIAEYATLALAGPEGNSNGWYLGLAPAGDPHYAVVVIVEDVGNVSAAQQIGRALLELVLRPRE